MDKVTHRLTRHDWLQAGFNALAKGGPAALRVEPVARALGATKGSFYWHFKGPDAWKSHMLAHWRDVGFSDVVAALQTLPKGAPRLRALVGLAAAPPAPAYGGHAAEPALREWARYDAEVAVAVRAMDAARIAYIEDCLLDAGLTSAHNARLLYAAYLGVGVLAAAGGASGQAELAALVDLLLGGAALAATAAQTAAHRA